MINDKKYKTKINGYTGVCFFEYNKFKSEVTIRDDISNIFSDNSTLIVFSYREFLKFLTPISSNRLTNMLSDGTIKTGTHIEIILADGEMKHVILNSNLTNRDDGIICCICVDVSKIIDDKINESYLARHDALTGLYNRRDFDDMLYSIPIPYILLIFDIDGLKLVNDVEGHIVGDEVIKHTAKSLRKVFINDYIARIGGDEFVVLIEGNDVIELKKSIIKNVKLIKEFNLSMIDIDISNGYAIIKERDEHKNAFRDAENILYHYKLSRRLERTKVAKQKLVDELNRTKSYVSAHGDRIGRLMYKLFYELGYKRREDIERAKALGELHDIGEIAIPDNLFFKQEQLIEDEWVLIRTHPEIGFNIVSNLMSEAYLSESILYHHENWDGSGYPFGKKGELIPLYARMLNITNAYDAMVNDQPYKKAISHKAALDEIKRCSGKQFDPKLGESFIKCMNDENTLYECDKEYDRFIKERE